MAEPRLIFGGIGVDDRGAVGFVNAFDCAGVKRFYTVRNHQAGFVRAWHAHRCEGKYVTAVAGVLLVGAVEIDDWEAPARDRHVWRHVIAASKPAMLYIPPGYANGFMSLTADAVALFLSTATIEESRGDDVRFPARHWDIWKIEER